MSVLLTERDDRGVVTLTINRPEVRNAMSPELMTSIGDTLTDLSDDPGVRVVVLTGAGDVFSAGGDLQWMKQGVDKDRAEHEADSARLADVFRVVDEFPAPVVGRMNGHAIAGGTGLMCACDVVVAVRGARMGFTEVRVGIAPATISRIVLPKIGPSAARRWFLTGELFDTDVARDIGLVHDVVDADDLDARVEDVIASLLVAAPNAQRRTKALIRTVMANPIDADRHTIPVIAELRVSDEGQEGMSAFFERRPAAWVPTEPPTDPPSRAARRTTTEESTDGSSS